MNLSTLVHMDVVLEHRERDMKARLDATFRTLSEARRDGTERMMAEPNAEVGAAYAANVAAIRAEQRRLEMDLAAVRCQRDVTRDAIVRIVRAQARNTAEGETRCSE